MYTKIFLLPIIFTLLVGKSSAQAPSTPIDSVTATALNALIGTDERGPLYNDQNQSSRPINQDVTFWCRNSGNTGYFQLKASDRNIGTKVTLSQPIFFIIHGWTRNLQNSWVNQTAQQFKKFNPTTNVCAIDWGRLAYYEYEISAKRYVYQVGRYIAKVIKNWNLNLSRVRLVGHSLGAQVAGEIGRVLGGQVAEIYALDPAGPLFCNPVPVTLNYRLDKSDAKYVQVILTCKGVLGCGLPITGHQTFFPNGGAAPQPNCPVAPNRENTYACSHSEVVNFFTRSLNPRRKMQAKKCINYVSYLWGACNFNQGDRLGIYAKGKDGRYFLRA